MTKTEDEKPTDVEKPGDYVQNYSEENFWTKLKRYALVAGRTVIRPALLLYYAAERPETPFWAKTTIYGALGYFIFPFDAIPDIIPLVGYSDDLGALVLAVAMVAAYIDETVKKKAEDKLQDWFGEDEPDSDDPAAANHV